MEIGSGCAGVKERVKRNERGTTKRVIGVKEMNKMQ